MFSIGGNKIIIRADSRHRFPSIKPTNKLSNAVLLGISNLLHRNWGRCQIALYHLWMQSGSRVSHKVLIFTTFVTLFDR